MKLLGVSIYLKLDKPEVKVERVEIIKETDKLYKVKMSGLVFDCLCNIPKNRINTIQKTSDYVNGFVRKMWIIDDGRHEQLVINTVKRSLRSEIEDRKSILNKLESNIELI